MSKRVSYMVKHNYTHLVTSNKTRKSVLRKFKLCQGCCTVSETAGA